MAEGRKNHHDVNDILTHYHIRCDTCIGIGRFSIRIITCSDIEFRNYMDLPWDPSLVPKDQPIYSSVKNANIIQY